MNINPQEILKQAGYEIVEEKEFVSKRLIPMVREGEDNEGNPRYVPGQLKHLIVKLKNLVVHILYSANDIREEHFRKLADPFITSKFQMVAGETFLDFS